MADKSVGELIAAQSVTPTDLFVLEQNGTAKKLTGQILENWLVSFADGHGGIRKIEKVSTSGNVDTYRIYLADLTFYDFTVTNGEDGFSPIAKVTQTETGAVISITDASGTTKAVVYDSNKDSVTIESVTGETKQLPAGTATTIASVSVKAGRYLVIANATFPAYPNLEKAEYVHMLGVNTSESFDHGKATAVGNVKSHSVDLNVATVVTLPSDGAIYMLGYAAETSTVTNCNLYAVQIVGKNGKNGVDGKSAYDYALDGGYTGTEKQFSEKMASGTLYITMVQDVTTGVITCSNTVMEAATAFKNGKPVCATFRTTDFSEYYSGSVIYSAMDVVDAFIFFEFVDVETNTGKRLLVKGSYHGENDEWSVLYRTDPPADGFSLTAKVEQTGTGAVISITDKSGTTTAAIANGKDGKDGADGAPGQPGQKGDKGDPGEKGEKGDKGDKGDRGQQGVQGVQGERGEQGQKGDKGDRGEQGIQGVQGEKGETGAQGAKGADGTPATHRWSGTTLYITSASGTSSANLKGEKGDKGEKGEKGADGTITFEDLTAEQKASLKGDKGDKGDPGTPASVFFSYGTTDLTAGSSALTTGKMHLVYE